MKILEKTVEHWETKTIFYFSSINQNTFNTLWRVRRGKEGRVETDRGELSAPLRVYN